MPYFLTDHLWYPDASGWCGTARNCLPQCLQLHRQRSPPAAAGYAGPGRQALMCCSASHAAQVLGGASSSLQQICPAIPGSEASQRAPALESLLQTARCTPTGRPPAACLVGTRTLCTLQATTSTCPRSPTVLLRWAGAAAGEMALLRILQTQPDGTRAVHTPSELHSIANVDCPMLCTGSASVAGAGRLPA